MPDISAKANVLRAAAALIVALFMHGIAHADFIAIPVDGESWSLGFDAPALKPLPLPFRPKGFAYFGNANRLNISFFVEQPSCAGGEEPSVRFTCFSATLAKNPFLVRESLRTSTMRNGVFVVYGVRAPFNAATVRQLHMHFLFYEGGKEIDFHASFVEPADADAAALWAIMQSVRILPQ